MLDLIPSAADLQSANGDYVCRCNGHLDESTALLATPADFVESYEAYTLDQSIQAADTAAIAELRETFTAAKEAIGNAPVRLSRCVSVSDEVGERTEKAEYYCSLASGAAFGVGVSPAAALADALDNLDKPIAPAFGGYTVPTVASVQAFPHRSKTEALAIARRIAIDATYLDVALEFALPGIIDERPRSVTLAA